MKGGVSRPWEASGAKEIDQDQRLSPQDRIAGIKAALRELRYPRLADYEKRFRMLKNGLKLPPGIRLNVPPYFEGSHVQLTIAADSPGNLRKLVSDGKSLLAEKELDQIFELL